MNRHNFIQLEKWADNIISSSYEHWPENISPYALSRPIESIPIALVDLEAIASQNRSYRQFRNKTTVSPLPVIQIPAEVELFDGYIFPKFGPISWKEKPCWMHVDSKALIYTMPMMLNSITNRLASIAHVYLFREVPLYIHFFPNVDLRSHGKEARFQIINGEPKRGTWQFECIQGIEDFEVKRYNTIVLELIKQFIDDVQIKNAILDVYLQEKDDKYELKLIDFNPIMNKSHRQLFNYS